MKEYYVYEWIRLDTNEPFYVGKGKDDRWRILNRGDNKHFNNIVKSIPVVVNILHDNLDEETAYGLECYYIWLYKHEIGYDLCNIDDGGFGGKMADETKQKISEKAKLRIGELNPFYGKSHTEETKKKISNANKNENHPMYGKSQSNETIEKRRQKIKGKKRTEDSRRKMSENHADVSGKNNPMYDVHRYGKSNPNSKSVICLTTRKIFFTAKEGAEYYKIKSKANICQCCKGSYKSAGKLSDGTKLVWRYLVWEHGKKFRIKK